MIAPLGSILQETVGAILCGLVTLLLALGMAVGFVPYVPTKDPVPDDVEGLKRGAAISVHATGIVGHDRSLRRYRHRPAVLEHRADGELRLLVRRLGLAPTDPNDVWSTAASADLTRSSVRSLSRGVAYLATDVRPAVRAIWKHGPLVLDFDDTETRDRVYAELARWSE